ncbi:MAG TPA: HEAT repeat domain-containing protein [Polyangiaceae bacterium]|nr:HEAT repeat domain-containing protein [Polyangiaceae bacterium]
MGSSVRFAALAALLSVSCSTPGYVKTAYSGDLATLKKEIQGARSSRELGRKEVLRLAEAVARREVFSARGEDAPERIHSVRPCIGAVESELRERARTEDDAGAESLLALVEAGRESRGSLVSKYGASPLGGFRAVAARLTTEPGDAPARRAFTRDPDERVRRAALRAAFEAKDPADVDALLEASRLDPDPSNRSLAIRAAGSVGGPKVALALADLYPVADRTVRLSIVEAWGMTRVFPLGGSGELLALAERGEGLPSVAAANELTRIGREGAREGRAVLVRAIAEGSTDERLVAIQVAPLSDPDVVPALRTAGKSEDAVVRVVALARLLEVRADRAAALAALETAAAGKDGAARQAAAALVAAGDPKAVPLLLPGLEGDEPAWRELAAVGLFRLGRAPEMASALADSDPAVRLGVACSVLAEDRPSG